MRRYDLDWLRVIVFGLLIFYHVGMFFVPWTWHIKNNDLVEGLMYPMMFVNQWRLPILFVISGMGTAFALSKKSGWQFTGERLKRLLIPLLTGILLVVPPQVYLERISSGGFSGSYFNFWPGYAFAGVYPAGNFSWHHLWFLPYLLFFFLVLIPVFLQVRKHPDSIILKGFRKLFSHWWGSFLLIIPLLLWDLLLRPAFPSTHAFWGDWYNMARYSTLFLYGYLCISSGNSFWRSVSGNRHRYLLAGMLSFSIYLFILFVEAKPWHIQALAVLRVVNMWSWIWCILGFASVLLNKPGKYLSYANEAVYPFYILHQTITVAIGFFLMNLQWGFPVKFTVMVAGTFGITFSLYEGIIKRWSLMRLLFGLKNSPSKNKIR